MARPVTSRHNPVVRTFRELAGTPDPAGARLLLDGSHLIRDAHAAGLSFETVALGASHEQEARELAVSLAAEGVDLLDVSDPVLRAMSPVRAPTGIVAIARRRPFDAAEICSRPQAFVLVLVDVQDPGNTGSLLRAAEAGGATGVLVCTGSANPFSWKALRGSMGSAFRLPVAFGLTHDDALVQLRRAGARTVATVARDGLHPGRLNWHDPVGIFLGGEGAGLPAALAASCDARVTIPMAPPVESLNVAVAGAVLVYWRVVTAGMDQR